MASGGGELIGVLRRTFEDPVTGVEAWCRITDTNYMRLAGLLDVSQSTAYRIAQGKLKSIPKADAVSELIGQPFETVARNHKRRMWTFVFGDLEEVRGVIAEVL